MYIMPRFYTRKTVCLDSSPHNPTLDVMGLDTVELVLEAEKHFGVSVPDERTEKTETVEQFARLLCELRARASEKLF